MILNNKKWIYIAVMLVAFIMVRCGTAEGVVDTPKHQSDKELREILFSKNEIPFDYFYSKISVDIKEGEKTNSFKTNLKLTVDTAFGGTINVAALIWGTYMVTRDSVMFSDKTKKCYQLETLAYLSTVVGTKLEFDFFQQLILGLPFGLDEDIKYTQIKSKDDYVLASHKKKEFKRLEQDKLSETAEEDIFIQYHLHAETFDLTSINIQIPSDTVEINIDYLSRKLEDGVKVPEETKISIVHPRNPMSISLSYGSIKLNEAREVQFKIPESYEPCK